MQRPEAAILLAGALSALAPSFASRADAQSAWLPREPGTNLELETDRVDVPGTGWVAFGTLRSPLSPNVHFVLEAPWTHAPSAPAVPGSGETEARSRLGNPYLGLELRRPNPRWYVDVGVRVPALRSPFRPAIIDLAARTTARASATTGGSLLPEGAQTVTAGFYADLRREEAFALDQLTVQTAFHATSAGGQVEGLGWDAQIAPLWIVQLSQGSPNTGGGSVDLLYGGTAWWSAAAWQFGAGFTGRRHADAEGLLMDRSSETQVDAAVRFLRSPLRPGLQWRLPLTPRRGDLLMAPPNYTLALTLDAHLGAPAASAAR